MAAPIFVDDRDKPGQARPWRLLSWIASTKGGRLSLSPRRRDAHSPQPRGGGPTPGLRLGVGSSCQRYRTA